MQFRLIQQSGPETSQPMGGLDVMDVMSKKLRAGGNCAFRLEPIEMEGSKAICWYIHIRRPSLGLE